MELAKVFKYGSNRIRTLIVDGEPWFVAKDVCEALEHSNSRMALERLDSDEKGVSTVYTPGGNQQMAVVNESGVYSLVFTSRIPRAKDFKRWVTHEVLPSIRKTGSYQTPHTQAEMLLAMAQQFVDQERRMADLETRLEVANHRLDSLDHVDVIGDKQQRLNAMIKKLAHRNGWTFSHAWREFTGAFNTAYRTNLTQRIENYRDKHGLKGLSRPQYLSMVDQLDDAIRVADKMLNPVAV